MSGLKVGDRIAIRPAPMFDWDEDQALADQLRGRRAWVVQAPWFLPMFDVVHVGLYVDNVGHAEVEVDWCVKLSAIDLLGETIDPPAPSVPWPDKATPDKSRIRWLMEWVMRAIS